MVSIGIPTFNRLAGLKRALESVQAQEYANIEIIISDNASTDGTEHYCRAVCESDPRVSYIRQDSNVGSEKNFAAALEAAHGEYFMWLADDDWIDPNYISLCTAYLSAHPDFVLAAGYAQYAETEDSCGTAGINAALTEDTPRERIASYYRTVLDNGAFYGVVRRAYLQRLPIRRIMGSDWFMMASLAAWGKVATLPGATLHRSAGGISKDAESMIRYYGLSGWAARQPFGIVASHAAGEILWRSPVHRRELGLMDRLSLGATVYATIIGRYADLNGNGSIAQTVWAAAHRAGFALIRLAAPVRRSGKA